ncbi:kinesin family member C1 protein [Puccinia sorghi]|uniref:Kinesin family member C1 protein n=1 Tax=Puccinia sorghi TaxID=27349 RepID=A0A0L6URM5_9BASI|nr:kinesin family member C1 protein [Puccinia sorghi]
MDKIKEVETGYPSCRSRCRSALERAETAEAKFKKLEQESMHKDQELTSLQHKVSNLEADLEAAEKKLSDAKLQREEEESNKSTNENLNRKIALLESELDNAEKNLRETTDKLRQVDVKAEHFERQVQRIESERDSWEKKWEETQEKYIASKRELEEVVQQMEVK